MATLLHASSRSSTRVAILCLAIQLSRQVELVPVPILLNGQRLSRKALKNIIVRSVPSARTSPG